ncbi:hypothetical protein AKO1_011175 [Acrasis kona]|uniref:Uncharacterized protein n=1 Tax=Acrasis kona TaxID=1008807 RepID=A0AAW2Z0I0_9EUKA
MKYINISVSLFLLQMFSLINSQAHIKVGMSNIIECEPNNQRVFYFDQDDPNTLIHLDFRKIRPGPEFTFLIKKGSIPNVDNYDFKYTLKDGEEKSGVIPPSVSTQRFYLIIYANRDFGMFRMIVCLMPHPITAIELTKKDIVQASDIPSYFYKNVAALSDFSLDVSSLSQKGLYVSASSDDYPILKEPKTLGNVSMNMLVLRASRMYISVGSENSTQFSIECKDKTSIQAVSFIILLCCILVMLGAIVLGLTFVLLQKLLRAKQPTSGATQETTSLLN